MENMAELKPFDNFFNNKRILVTGHTGFKGSWLSIWLKELGAEVIGYGLAPCRKEDNFCAAGLSERMIDLRGDIRDMPSLQKAFKEHKPEIVFHLAAQPLVGASYLKPVETYEVNVLGTLNVLECIRYSRYTRIGLIVTSDKCYENREQLWGYRETDRLGGFDPYSSSKGCAELLTASYRNSFLNPDDFNAHKKTIATLRAGNVIGGGDWSQDRLIPDCMRALLENRDIIIRNASSVRPWQHVLDALGGYLTLACRMYPYGINYGGAWNFGPNPESIVSVGEIVSSLIQKWESNISKLFSCSDSSFHEAALLSLDCAKAKSLLGWKPKLSIDEALNFTVEWYKNFTKSDPYEICVRQIRDYMLRN